MLTHPFHIISPWLPFISRCGLSSKTWLGPPPTWYSALAKPNRTQNPASLGGLSSSSRLCSRTFLDLTPQIFRYPMSKHVKALRNCPPNLVVANQNKVQPFSLSSAIVVLCKLTPRLGSSHSPNASQTTSNN